MKNILGWLIAGVGVYYLYEKYYAPSNTLTTTPVQPGTTPTQNAQNPTTSVSTSTPPVVSVNPQGSITAQASATVTQFQQYLINNGLVNQLHDLDEWNWYLTQATGATGPAIEDVGISVRSTQMNSTSYSNLIGMWLSGVAYRLSGLGRITMAQTYGVPANNLYANKAGIPDRPTIIPTGFELASKKVH